MIIKFNNTIEKSETNTSEDKIENNYKVIDFKIYFDKSYYDNIVKYCNYENMSINDFMNDAIDMYMSLNYIYEYDEYQKNMEISKKILSKNKK